MTDLPTLSYTSTSEIPTLSYPWPEAWERYPFRAEPLRIDHYREYLPSGSNPNRYSLVMGLWWAKLTEKESTARLVIFFFFSFFLFCSLTVATFFMLFLLTTEPDPKLHRPFHSGTFFSSQVKQVVFLEKYSGWTCCIAFQNRTYIEIRAWLLKATASNCHLSTL